MPACRVVRLALGEAEAEALERKVKRTLSADSGGQAQGHDVTGHTKPARQEKFAGKPVSVLLYLLASLSSCEVKGQGK